MFIAPDNPAWIASCLVVGCTTIIYDSGKDLNMYVTITLIVAIVVVISSIMKLRRSPRVVQTIHEVVGVPLEYFPLLALCEVVGAVGLVLGIFRPLVGIVSGMALVLFFIGAILSHLRVRDFGGAVPAFLMFVAVTIALAMRLHLGPHPDWYKF